MERPEILMTPGPTPVPPEVLLAQGSPFPYHRGPGYTKLLTEITEGLKKLMKTEHDVVLFAASGTGGLESVAANLFSPGDRVIVPVAGYFGERFAKIAQAFRCRSPSGIASGNSRMPSGSSSFHLATSRKWPWILGSAARTTGAG